MTHLPLDRKAANLLNRVSSDINHLRDDLSDLWNHTTSKTLPRAARELGDMASNRVAAGGAYAAGRLRRSINRHTRPQHSSGGWMTGAVALGLVAAGVYALLKNAPTDGSGRGSARSDGGFDSGFPG